MTPTLCFTGMLLFLLGLVNGLAIPRMRSPRLGLSGHLAGVQSGTFLLAAGLLWPNLAIGERLAFISAAVRSFTLVAGLTPAPWQAAWARARPTP